MLFVILICSKAHERFNQIVAKIKLRIYFHLEMAQSILATIQDLTEKSSSKGSEVESFRLYVSFRF